MNPALSLLMKHLIIGQHQKLLISQLFIGHHNGRLVSICQHFVIRRVVFTEKDQNKLNYRIRPKRT